MRAHVIDSYIGAGTDDGANRPSITALYTVDWEDITGTPTTIPDPNSIVIEIEAPESTIDAIDADPDYYITWSENA